MTEVEADRLRATVVVGYEDWNAALADAFFVEERAGELVYLDKDDPAFDAACAAVGVTPEDADESLADAVRANLCWKESGRTTFAYFDLMTKSWVAKRRKAFRESTQVPPPPHVALLTLFSLAAERIGEANAVTGAAESGYYSSLEEMLGISRSESPRMRSSFMKSSEAYWESLSLWLEDQNGQRGLPSAYALMHRYVGLPISQALVRARERRNLKRMFEEQGFVPGMSVAHTDMYGAIDVWLSSSRTSANPALVKMWASSEIRNRIVEIALAEFVIWEGGSGKGQERSHSGQRSQRCLLTLRDHRGMLRSEMRFGLMVGTNGFPGDTCRIASVEAAARSFPLEQIGAASAGFDFRAVGLDVASAVAGDLRVVVNETHEMRRFPKNVVILTQDAFSAGYVESDRINAAVMSRILVRNEPQIIAAVESVLTDAAQPGYTRHPEETSGVPRGWTVFSDVMLLRAPSPALVTAPDLSAFQPRLSTQMTITGGLKLPGHMQRWSALAPIRVIIASETDEPVDLVALTRNPETLQAEERILGRGLAVPSVVDLASLPLEVHDFTLALRRGKTTLQTLAVKLRSSQEPSPDISSRFKELTHDLGSPLWPIQAVPSDEAVAPGVDGISVSAPIIEHEVSTIASRPDWNHRGRMSPQAGLLVVKGPPADSCIVTGRHRFDFPTFDGKRPKSKWMYGVCIQCGMSKRQPTWAPKNKAIMPPNTDRSRSALPTLISEHPNWEALIDSLFFLGAGSRREFSVLARQLEDTALFESKLLLDLEALGVIELERNAELEVVRWEAAATCAGELADGTWLLTGYWDKQMTSEVLAAFENVGATISVIAPAYQAMHVIGDISALDMADIAEKFEFVSVPQAGVALAKVLPPLSTIAAALDRRNMPFADSFEYFDTASATWMVVETAVLPGLYRVSQSFSSRYYYRDSLDIAENRAALVTVELGKHLAALVMKRPLIAYDANDKTLSVPVGAELPGIYARAALMGDGDLPQIRKADRSVNYFNVPADAAAALIGKLTS